MSTGSVTVWAALNMFDGMIEQDQKSYVTSLISDSEDPTELEYELKDTTAFVLGAASDPNPNKKNKGNMTKARGPTFTRFEDI
ncbi:hypothetical protein D1007_51961 [Hordeum vulgare]|nr:hypothetical protein D1007_51961 [Hordeum vulgare]